MPANRSRTHEWRRSLQQLHERNGSIEVAVTRSDDDENSRHLLWRVRVLKVTDEQIIIEQPSALGRVIPLQEGVELACVFAIGQNRWMFKTTVQGSMEFRLNGERVVSATQLAAPDNVERCQRRNYYRIETTSLHLPQVEMWPLYDPKSVVLAERACEIEFNRLQGGEGGMNESKAGGASGSFSIKDAIMPEVGPKFTAELTNIGGGGMGVRVNPDDAGTLGRHKVFWLRFTLPPELSTPICATGKMTHSHMDSTQATFAGLAFDFSFNPGHQNFMIDQICRYIALQQRAELNRKAV